MRDFRNSESDVFFDFRAEKPNEEKVKCCTTERNEHVDELVLAESVHGTEGGDEYDKGEKVTYDDGLSGERLTEFHADGFTDLERKVVDVLGDNGFVLAFGNTAQGFRVAGVACRVDGHLHCH